MRKALSLALVICITFLGPIGAATAQDQQYPAPAQDQQYPAPAQDSQAPAVALFSADQLDNLVAPIALYPDPLLAQVLPASTFVDQIDEASRFVRANNDPNAIDAQPWDVSVKSVAHYPSVLYMMSSKIDWTTSLGQAYVNQSTDVMTSIQRLRALAHSAGNLVTNRQQEVIAQGPYIQIVPIQPQYIYVPVYDPYAVYYRSGYGFGGGFGGNLISFGAGFAIGAWLNDDFNWGEHRVFYHGWRGDEGGWIGRSRPMVRINNTYVNNTYTNIHINRTVINNNVNYTNLNRYSSVHRNVTYNNVAAPARANANNPANRGNQGNPVAANKIIQRNVNTNDPRIGAYRGRQPVTAQPATPPSRAATSPETRAQAPRNEAVRPAVRPAILPTARPNSPPAVRPASLPAPHPAPIARSAPRPPSPVFSGNRSGFDPRAASQRGQASRASANQYRAAAPSQSNTRNQSRPANPPAKNSGQSKPGGRR